MDVNIRQVLAAANATSNTDHARNLLHQAHKLLDVASKETSYIEGQSPCGSDLFIIAAEIAIKLQETKIAEGLLQMYFQGLQVTDQFLCRAYICKAQLLSSKSPNSSTDLDSAVVFLLKAINFAKDKPRYHFIVYNVSVLFWQNKTFRKIIFITFFGNFFLKKHKMYFFPYGKEREFSFNRNLFRISVSGVKVPLILANWN